MSKETASTGLDTEHREPEFWKSLAASAVFFVKQLTAASTYPSAQRRIVELSSATQLMTLGATAESSTQLREMTPEVRARVEALLDAARYDIIEDGMQNVVTDRLPELIIRHFSTVIPALVSVIETGRTTPAIAAEVLKELGRLHNAASHPTRLWTLERALGSSSPIIRDGAGLGLARLADPHALPYLRRAVENEPDAQMRTYLQLVVDELAETITDGAAVTEPQ